jgi:hypothetical protein
LLSLSLPVSPPYLSLSLLRPFGSVTVILVKLTALITTSCTKSPRKLLLA